MSSTPRSEKLVCPTCNKKMNSTKTFGLPGDRTLQCLSCKTPFRLDEARLAPAENVQIDLTSVLPPPLESIPPIPGIPMKTPSYFEPETTIAQRTQDFTQDIVSAIKPKSAWIPLDIREVLDVDDVVFANHPSNTAKWLNVLRLGLLMIPLFVVMVIALVFAVSRGRIEIILAAFLGLVFAMIPFYAVHLYWRNTFFVLTRDKIVVRSGIFNRTIKIAWLANIQEISINSGVIDRWLNLNTIHFSTASSSGWVAGWLAGGIWFRYVELKPVLRALKSVDL